MQKVIFIDPSQVPENFWRVSVKAIIFDIEARVLMFKDANGTWEVPGGGWDHAETLDHCVQRELLEEVAVSVRDIGDVIFCYPGKTINGYPKINVAVRVSIDDSPLRPSSDNLVEARYVTKKEFLELPFQSGEEPIMQCADKIWPNTTAGY